MLGRDRVAGRLRVRLRSTTESTPRGNLRRRWPRHAGLDLIVLRGPIELLRSVHATDPWYGTWRRVGLPPRAKGCPEGGRRRTCLVIDAMPTAWMLCSLELFPQRTSTAYLGSRRRDFRRASERHRDRSFHAIFMQISTRIHAVTAETSRRQSWREELPKPGKTWICVLSSRLTVTPTASSTRETRRWSPDSALPLRAFLPTSTLRVRARRHVYGACTAFRSLRRVYGFSLYAHATCTRDSCVQLQDQIHSLQPLYVHSGGRGLVPIQAPLRP